MIDLKGINGIMPNESFLIQTGKVLMASLEDKTKALREEFGRQIKDARQELGYSQSKLATMCGLTRNYISKIECGIRMPHPASLIQFSEILGIDFTISARGCDPQAQPVQTLTYG